MSSRKPSTRILLALASLTVLALSGCQNQPHAIARVGTRVVTEAQFRAAAASVADRIPLPPDSAKLRLLDMMEQRELLLVAAKGNPALPDSYVTRRRNEIEEQALVGALLAQLNPASVGVSDAEVKQLYLSRQQSTHFQLILTTDRAAARQARAAVDAGRDFGAVADQFDATASVPPGGDFGFVNAGEMVDPLDRIVRETPVGAVMGPVDASGRGWIIVKVLARRPNEQPALTQVEPQLRTMLGQRKQRIVRDTRLTTLLAEYAVTSDPEGMRLMYQRLNGALQQGDTSGSRIPMRLSPEERAMAVGRWDGGPHYRGSLTLGEAEDLVETGRSGQLDAARLDLYDPWVKNAIMQKVAVIEARRRHLDEEPQIAERIKQAVEEIQLQAVVQTEVSNRADPTDQEVQQAYEGNAPAFAQLKSVKVQYITLPDSALAVRTAEKSMEAGTLKNAVMLSSASFAVHEETVGFPTSDPLWQMLQPALAQQRINQLIGPIHLTEGWRVVQIIDRDAPVPQFAQLTIEQQNGIRQQARQVATQRRLQVYTDSLRRVIPVVVDRERLRRIPWPTPSMFQPPPGMPGMPG